MSGVSPLTHALLVTPTDRLQSFRYRNPEAQGGWVVRPRVEGHCADVSDGVEVCVEAHCMASEGFLLKWFGCRSYPRRRGSWWGYGRGRTAEGGEGFGAEAGRRAYAGYGRTRGLHACSPSQHVRVFARGRAVPLLTPRRALP